MSILLPSEVIRQTQFVKSWKDIYYNSLMEIVYSSGKFKTLTDKAWRNEERGKECMDLWRELFIWQLIVEYLINLRDDLFHVECLTQEDIDAGKLDYNLECVRNSLLCSCKDVTLFDKLVIATGLSVDGLDNMVEEGLDDQCDNPWIIT